MCEPSEPYRPPIVTDETGIHPEPPEAGTSRPLTPAAQRALAEAEERRMQQAKTANAQPPETGGRGGLDPVRYGDWEKAGLASDF